MVKPEAPLENDFLQKVSLGYPRSTNPPSALPILNTFIRLQNGVKIYLGPKFLMNEGKENEN